MRTVECQRKIGVVSPPRAILKVIAPEIQFPPHIVKARRFLIGVKVVADERRCNALCHALHKIVARIHNVGLQLYPLFVALAGEHLPFLFSVGLCE